jgi:hypothetical protein
VSQADKRRRRARAAAQRAVRPSVPVPDTSTSTSTEPNGKSWPGKPPNTSGNPETQWKPGQAPNPNGYSRGRRIADALHRALDKRGLDDDVATTVIAMALGQKLGDRVPHLEWFRELRSMIDGPNERIERTSSNDTTVNVVAVSSASTSTIDPAVAERVMAAAEPDVTIDEDVPENVT